jgi:hypothetical protein
MLKANFVLIMWLMMSSVIDSGILKKISLDVLGLLSCMVRFSGRLFLR